MFPRIRSRLTVAALALVTACGKDSTAPSTPDTSIEPDSGALIFTGNGASVLSSRAIVLTLGQTRTFTVSSQFSRNSSVRWSSSNPGAVQVSSSGTARVVGEGLAAVTASSRYGRQSWSVYGLDAARASMRISPDSAALPVGTTLPVSVTMRSASGVSLDASGAQLQVTNPAVATITASKAIQAVAPGDAQLRSTLYGVSSTAPIHVSSVAGDPTVPMVTALTLSPKTSSVSTGATVQFNTTATWTAGGSGLPALSYSSSGGVINTSTGLWTAPSATGTYRVIVRQTGGTLADTATVTVVTSAPVATGLTMTPASASVFTGGTQQFASTVAWSDGQSRQESVTYRATGGTISATGLFTAGQTPGSYTVIATCACGVADTSYVTVSAAYVTALTISPKTANLLTGGLQRFAAAAVWSDGGTVLPAVTYSAPNGGTVTADGVFTAPATAGTYRVILGFSGTALRDTAVLTVNAPTATAFTLTPGTATLAAGATQQFSTSTTWSDGQARTSTVTYSATGGTISASGLYTAGRIAGTFAVIANCSCGRADTAAVDITAPQLLTMAISPKSATVSGGGTQQFSVSGTWSTGETTPPPVTYSAPNGGTVNSTGLFSAPATAGTYRVIAAHTGGTRRDTALVTVTAPQLTSLVISPNTASVAAGGTQQFSVSGSWSTGATTPPPVTYSAPNGGSVTSAGLFTAPTTAGTYRVIAAHTGGTHRDTATVTVTSSNTGTSGTAAPTAFTPNLPAGLTMVTDSRFLGMQKDVWSDENKMMFSWDGRITTDVSAPYGGNVFETFYAGNNAGNGEGGAILWGSEKNFRRMYFSLMMWVPTNYSVHTCEEKFFYPVVNVNGSHSSSTIFGWYLLGSETANGSTFSLGMDAQIGQGRIYQPTSGAKMRKGVWQRVEFYIEMNTPGQANGVWKAWVDGQVAIDRNDVRFSNASSQATFDAIRFDGTRGCGASSVLTPPGGQVRRYNRLAFYGSTN